MREGCPRQVSTQGHDARRAANQGDVSRKPRLTRGPRPLSFGPGLVAFKALEKSLRRWTDIGAPRVLSLVGRRGPAGREGGAGERRWGQRLQRAPRGPVTLSFPQRPRRAGHLG